MSSATVNTNSRNRCFRILRKVSSVHGVLPKSYFPTGVTLSDTIPLVSGGFADIWMGQQDGKQVCIKAFRTQTATDPEKIKRVSDGSLLRLEVHSTGIRGSTVRSWGGSIFPIRTSNHSLECPSHCSHFPSSVLGCRTRTSSISLGSIGKSIDCVL